MESTLRAVAAGLSAGKDGNDCIPKPPVRSGLSVLRKTVARAAPHLCEPPDRAGWKHPRAQGTARSLVAGHDVDLFPLGTGSAGSGGGEDQVVSVPMPVP